MLKRFTTFLFTSTLLICLGSLNALAYNGGITGATTSGCTCHGSSSSNTTVSIQGVSGTVTMAPGEQRNFTIVVAHSSQSHGGFNLAVVNGGGSSVGSLSAGSGSQLQGTELTHTAKKAMSGGETSWTFSYTAPTSVGTYTMKAAGNAVNNNGAYTGDVYNFMSGVTISVETPMTVTAPNGGETWCKGDQKTITWNPIGITGNVKIELSTNNGSGWSEIATVAVTPATYQWTIPTSQTASNQCLVKVTSVSTSTATDVSDAVFAIKANPSITTQPTSTVNVCAGQPINLTVNTDNNASYTFKWRKAGVPINGATNPTYSIASSSALDAGSYDCVVSGCSDVTSQQATVTIKTAPQLLSQSDDTSACLGKPVKLVVNANGTAITYQWRKAGTNITGETNNTLNIASLTNTDLALYDCVITGECNPPITSAQMRISVSPAPTITKQPRDTSICSGKELQFNIDATGNNLQYEWKRNGSVISGAQGPSYVIGSTSDESAGTYQVTVLNECGSATNSSEFKLTVKLGVTLVSQTNDTIVKANTVTRLRAIGSGPNARYKWSKGGQTRGSDTLSTLTINSTKVADAGNYVCTIFNSCGTVDTKVIKLTVTEPTAGPSLIATDATVDFACAKIGATEKMTTKITNGGGSPLNVTKVTLSGAGFVLTAVTTPFTLAANEEKSLEISFTASAAGDATGSLTFESNSETANPTIGIKGKGCEVKFDLSTASLGKTFITESKDTVLKVKNTGNADAIISAFNITGDGKAAFTVTPPATPYTLKVNETMDIAIKFTPTNEEVQTIMIEVGADIGSASFSVSAQGEEKGSTSVEDDLIQGITIAPNPAYDVMTLTVNATQASLRVIDAMGVTVFAPENGNHFIWNTKTVAAGRYMAMFTIGNTSVTVPLSVIR